LIDSSLEAALGRGLTGAPGSARFISLNSTRCFPTRFTSSDRSGIIQIWPSSRGVTGRGEGTEKLCTHTYNRFSDFVHSNRLGKIGSLQRRHGLAVEKQDKSRENNRCILGTSLKNLLCRLNPNKKMAKALTKSQVLSSIAESAGISKKQSAEIMDIIVDLAYKNAKNTFTLPGIGKLVLVNRKARIGRNPATGEQIQIAAKRVVKFRVAKAAKDAILGAKK
jgi:DNA-binding protein HU-beta